MNSMLDAQELNTIPEETTSGATFCQLRELDLCFAWHAPACYRSKPGFGVYGVRASLDKWLEERLFGYASLRDTHGALYERFVLASMWIAACGLVTMAGQEVLRCAFGSIIMSALGQGGWLLVGIGCFVAGLMLRLPHLLVGWGLCSYVRGHASLYELCKYRLEWVRMIAGAESVYPSLACNDPSQSQEALARLCVYQPLEVLRRPLAHAIKLGGYHKAMGYLQAQVVFTVPVSYWTEDFGMGGGHWDTIQHVRLDYSWEEVKQMSWGMRLSWYRHRAACRAGLSYFPLVYHDAWPLGPWAKPPQPALVLPKAPQGSLSLWEHHHEAGALTLADDRSNGSITNVQDA